MPWAVEPPGEPHSWPQQPGWLYKLETWNNLQNHLDESWYFQPRKTRLKSFKKTSGNFHIPKHTGLGGITKNHLHGLDLTISTIDHDDLGLRQIKANCILIATSHASATYRYLRYPYPKCQECFNCHTQKRPPKKISFGRTLLFSWRIFLNQVMQAGQRTPNKMLLQKLMGFFTYYGLCEKL